MQNFDDSQRTVIEESQSPEREAQGNDYIASFFVGAPDQGQPASHQAASDARHGAAIVPDSYVRVNRAPLPALPNTSVPPGVRLAHDRLKPEHAATFPNVHRVYDEKSRAVAGVSWEFCSPQEIWSIVSCKFLGSGKCSQRTETMTYYRTQLLKHVWDLLKNFVRLANDPQTSEKVLH